MKKFAIAVIILAWLGTIHAEIPLAFDLRDVNGENFITGVRRQTGGTCWTHGTMAALESNLLITSAWRDAGEIREPDLAEYHLDWWNGFNEFYNDDIYPVVGYGLTVHQGGDYRVSAAYLGRGDGAVRDIDGQSYDYTPDFKRADYHYFYVRDIEWYTMDIELEGIKAIKEAVMTSGAVATCMCSNSNFISGNIHYQPPSDARDPNHSIAIIGWDDKKITSADQAGAWLCKNSWGSGWGNDGYFWISYYDKHACKHPEMGAVSFRNVEPMRYDKVYYHDYHGWRATLTDYDEAFNAFETSRSEYLKAVSFYTAADSVDYIIKIYNQFESGALSGLEAVESGTMLRSGFHTVDLDTLVYLQADTKFYVYLYVSHGGQAFDRTSEVPVLLGSSEKSTVVESVSEPGQSYYFDGTGWQDMYDYVDLTWGTHNANFCIKALSCDTTVAVSFTDCIVTNSQLEVSLPIRVKNFFDISSVELAIQFFDSIAGFKRIEPSASGPVFDVELARDKLVLSWADLSGSNPIRISDGVLATLWFDYTNGETPVEFLNRECDVRNRQSEAVGISYSNGMIRQDYSEPPMYLLHDTGQLQMAVYNEGSIAADNATRSGPGIIWNGHNGAYVGGLIFGSSGRGRINGLLGSFASLYLSLVEDFQNIRSNFSAGFLADADFDQISEAVFDDSGAMNPYGVEIIQMTYSDSGDDFIYLRYGFVNKGNSVINDFYAGLFIDWDIGTYSTNLGGYDIANDLVYERGSDIKYHFGVTAISGLAGMKITEKRSSIGDSDDIRRQSFEWISAVDDQAITRYDDLRSWVGSSVGDLIPGDTSWVSFAIVAGNSLAEIQTNAQAARQKALDVGWSDIEVQIAGETQQGFPDRYCLHQNYPNPFNPATTIRYEIPRKELVTIQIYDLNGHLVETLLDEEKTAGVYQLNWENRELSSGIYFYRMKCGSFNQTKKLTILK